MAVQSGLVAGTGPRCDRTAVSRSQWLVVMLDPMISMTGERMARLLDNIPEADRPTVLAALDALVEAAHAT